jgi:hypothetical protein
MSDHDQNTGRVPTATESALIQQHLNEAPDPRITNPDQIAAIATRLAAARESFAKGMVLILSRDGTYFEYAIGETGQPDFIQRVAVYSDAANLSETSPIDNHAPESRNNILGEWTHDDIERLSINELKDVLVKEGFKIVMGNFAYKEEDVTFPEPSKPSDKNISIILRPHTCPTSLARGCQTGIIREDGADKYDANKDYSNHQFTLWHCLINAHSKTCTLTPLFTDELVIFSTINPDHRWRSLNAIGRIVTQIPYTQQTADFIIRSLKAIKSIRYICRDDRNVTRDEQTMFTRCQELLEILSQREPSDADARTLPPDIQAIIDQRPIFDRPFDLSVPIPDNTISNQNNFPLIARIYAMTGLSWKLERDLFVEIIGHAMGCLPVHFRQEFRHECIEWFLQNQGVEPDDTSRTRCDQNIYGMFTYRLGNEFEQFWCIDEGERERMSAIAFPPRH